MLKRVVRSWIKEENWLYLSWYKGNFGLFPALRAYARLHRDKGIGRAPNPLTGGMVFLRPGTTDQNAYDQVFLDREYDLDLGEPENIIDAGAHIGMAAVFFASRYPKAKVVAIEPEPSNYEVLSRNARECGNIHTVQAGLWNRKTHLRIEDSSVDTWSFRVVEDASGNGIPALSLQDIMREHGLERIDVLKLDIEGSEVEVLNNAQPWIATVKNLLIELHDRFRPGCTEALHRALQGWDYDESESGESVVIRDLRALPSSLGRRP